MSTAHITDELNAALESARAIKAKNDAERQRLLDEKAAADQKLVDDLEASAALARAAQQQHEDDAEARERHLAQANRIAGVTPEPALEPQAPDEPAAAPAVVDHDADDAGNPPTVAAPVVVVEEDETEAPRWSFRPQSTIQWIMALLGALIGFVIGAKTAEWPLGDFTGTAYNVLSFVWVVFWTAFGFGLGGWIAWRFEHRNTNQH